jgi:hypothetical protein
MKHIINIIILLILLSCNSEDKKRKILYHEYRPTSSSWDIIEWNIKNPSKKQFVLKEIVDSLERVESLEFLMDGEIISPTLCYLANKITYKYEQNIIIEKLYHSENELLATDCESWFKSTYHLDNIGKIERIERFSKYDFSKMDSIEIQKWKNEWAPEYREVKPDSIKLFVDYYYYSFAKMNRNYPVSENNKLSEKNYDFYFGKTSISEPEKTSILEGIKN